MCRTGAGAARAAGIALATIRRHATLERRLRRVTNLGQPGRRAARPARAVTAIPTIRQRNPAAVRTHPYWGPRARGRNEGPRVTVGVEQIVTSGAVELDAVHREATTPCA